MTGSSSHRRGRVRGGAAPVIGLVLACALTAGCGSGQAPGAADKSGGSTGPVVLRLAASDTIDQPDSRTIRYFAAQVARLSRGSLRIRITFDAAGDRTADVEQRTAAMVRTGRYELGWIGARAWDETGVTSLRALQAPFLVTSYRLLHRVVTSALADEMLAGLRDEGVVGVALLPGLLRHPIGLGQPLTSPADFAGARVRDIPSRTTDALLRALGATPEHVANADIPRDLGSGRLDGEELSLANAPPGGIVTANVTFFAKALTLFAGKRAYSRLSSGQRAVLRTAAERTIAYLAPVPGHSLETDLARQVCSGEVRVVLARARDRSGLVRAARPVYAQLERDTQTRSFIARIRRLKATTPQDPAFLLPRSCRLTPAARPASDGALRSPSILNGTYHLVFTRAAAQAFGPPATNPENDHYPAVETRILDDGRSLWGGGDRGTYTIRGNTVTFASSNGGGPESFTFTRDAHGTLRLTPLVPMDPGDEWVTAGVPWHRIGPPTKKLG